MSVVQQQPTPIKIGMVLDQPFPPDARVEREASALAQAGYQVHLLCLATPETVDLDPIHMGVCIHRVNPADVVTRWLGISHRLPFKGVYKTWQWNTYNVDTAWQILISRLVKRLGIDVLHVHDLKLVPTALAVADRQGIPVVADLHENYPALMVMMKGRDANGERNEEKIAKVKARWEQVEKLSCWQADRVLVVTEEAADRLVRQGIAANKITVIPNTVDGAKFDQAVIDQDIIRRYQDSFLLTYVGHVNGPHRGIETALEALSVLKSHIPNIRFVAAGAVRDGYAQQLKALATRLQVEDRVDWTGWLDESDFASYIKAAKVCLCPHLANDHTNATFPNKLYLYHWFNKPVVATDCVPIQRYINDSQGGLVYASGNAHQLAQHVHTLYQDDFLRNKLGQAGRQYVVSQGNWGIHAPRLVALYDELMTSTWSEMSVNKPYATKPDPHPVAMQSFPLPTSQAGYPSAIL